MGMPSEFFTRPQILERFGEIRDLMPGHPDNPISGTFRAGDVTDDTLTTLMVAEMLIENRGGVDQARFVAKLCDWAGQAGKAKQVIGPSTRAALDRITQGVDMAEAGKAGTTNGAAMRVAPLGMIADMGDLPALVEQVRLLCLPTHNTGAAIAGACAVAAAVGCAVSGEESVRAVIDCAVRVARLGEREGYPVVSPSVAERIPWAAELALAPGTEAERLGRVYHLVGTGLPIADSVPAAFAMLAMSEGDPVRCAHLSANLGGDTDTIGAMATAVCGALRGPDAFPAEQIALTAKVNQIDFAATAESLMRIRRSLYPREADE
jgi:ADP-ribosylglycohydrolase